MVAGWMLLRCALETQAKLLAKLSKGGRDWHLGRDLITRNFFQVVRFIVWMLIQPQFLVVVDAEDEKIVRNVLVVLLLNWRQEPPDNWRAHIDINFVTVSSAAVQLQLIAFVHLANQKIVKKRKQ